MHLRFLRRLRLPRRPLVTKVAKRGGSVVVLAYLAYLLVINLALATGHGIGLPDDVKVTFASAWSWYPGQVQAREVRLIATDSHVQWQLDIEHVRFRLSLTDLFRRRFHASHVRGSGIVLRIRQKLDAGAATPAALAVLPPIEGIPDPPIMSPVPLPALSDEDYNLWSPELDDVDAKDVREVWFDAYRFTGEAHVVGGFALRPLRMVRVGPASVDVTRGELRMGKETALEGLSGHFDATIAPFDPREVSDVSFLRYVTVALRGDGRIASLRFVNHYFPEPKLDGGAGPAHVDVRILNGVLTAPSRASVDLEPAVITADEHRVSASAHVELVVQTEPERPEASVSIDLAGLDVRHARAQAPILVAARIVAHGRSADLDLVRPFGDGTGSVEIPGADLPDLRSLNEYLGKDAPSLRAGRAHVHGAFSASLPAHSAKGDLALVTDGLVVHVGDSDLQGTADANLVLGEFDFQSRRADLSGSRIEARDVVLSSAPKEPAWWSRVALEKAHLSLGGPARLHSTFTLQAKDGRPILRQMMPVWMANFIGLDGLHGGGTVTMAASFVDLTGLHVEGGSYDIRGEFDKRGQSSHGVALAKSVVFTVGFELNDGVTSLRLLGAEDWFRRAIDASAAHGRT